MSYRYKLQGLLKIPIAFKTILGIFFALYILSAQGAGVSQSLSDEEIASMFIQQSQLQYQGSCPCPYNDADDNSICGGRSAWSKPGGEEPFCYVNDVPKGLIDFYRKTLNP